MFSRVAAGNNGRHALYILDRMFYKNVILPKIRYIISLYYIEHKEIKIT